MSQIIDNEQRAEALYNYMLTNIIYPMIGNKTTYLSQLKRCGIDLFGHSFEGVFPADKIPQLNTSKYCILNLDKSTEPGSHWIAVAKDGDKSYVYDSFGRDFNEIIPSIKFSGNGTIIDVDDDAEQNVIETDCGARCLAFLLVCEHWGVDMAKLI